jgi:hypothetical protein
MKEKKKLSNVWIAVTHDIIVGIIFTLINVAAAFILVLSIKSVSSLSIALSVVKIIAIWLGVMFSAYYLKKTYIIENKNKIVNLATIYVVVVDGANSLLQIFNGKIVGIDIVFFLAGLILMFLLFYVFSLKYIQNT